MIFRFSFILFFAFLNGQSSILKGSLKESGYFIKDLSIQWKSEHPKTGPSYFLDLNKFSISVQDIEIFEEGSTKKSKTTIQYSGPEIQLDKLNLKKVAYDPNWIAREYLQQIDKHHQLPKKAIGQIVDGITLYYTDHQSYPASLNELDVNHYVNMNVFPFDSPYWHYELDLPFNINAYPTRMHPIKTVNNVQFNLQEDRFILDRITDSLTTVSHTFWTYSFELMDVSQTLTSQIEMRSWDGGNQHEFYFDNGAFQIQRAHFLATPENSIHNRLSIKLPRFELNLEELLLSKSDSSNIIIESGKLEFRGSNFEINIPEGLSHEPEMAQLLEMLGIWNNTLKIRDIQATLFILNRHTGLFSANLNSPFIDVNIEGEFLLHQEGYFPEISFYNTNLTVNPIALGVRDWIKRWEKREQKKLKRKGSTIYLEMDGALFHPIFHGIN